MRMPDGSDHPFRGDYREIVPSERLVYTVVLRGDRPTDWQAPNWLTGP